MHSQDQGRSAGRHWTVIETGSNQAYIFASNKQAVNVGASHLIHQAGTVWVTMAIEELDAPDRVRPVVLASGKALLIVDSPATGRTLIEAVTRRALTEAPGLEIWGVTDPTPIANDSEVGAALTRALQLHAAWRSRRPTNHLRHPALPFTQTCHYSGLPAANIGREGDDRYPRAATIHKAWAARDHGRARMVSNFGADAVAPLDDEAVSARLDLRDSVMTRPTRRNDGVAHAGWIAVVHADGNGLGEIFRRLTEAYKGEEYLHRLQVFSEALDTVTIEALRIAVAEHTTGKGWILPLVVGGDDVTAVMDARAALSVTATFLTEFARESARHPAITEVVAKIRGLGSATGADLPPGLTACAGIAYVKPRHSFSEAYQLAEELCTSAKQIKRIDPRANALDFHVMHDSFGRDLAKARDLQTAHGLRLWAGPVVLGEACGDWAQAHHYNQLIDALRGLTTNTAPDEPGLTPDAVPLISRAGLHQLREALFAGEAAIDRAVAQVAAWSPDPAKAQALLKQHVRVTEPATEPGSATRTEFSRLISAIDLLDMQAGTVVGTARERERVHA